MHKSIQQAQHAARVAMPPHQLLRCSAARRQRQLTREVGQWGPSLSEGREQESKHQGPGACSEERGRDPNS